MTTKMLIASTTEEENSLFRKKVAPLLGDCYSTVVPESYPTSVVSAIDPKVGLVVLNLRLVRANHKNLIREIRNSGYSGWILIVGRPYAPELVVECKRMENVHFVERPFENTELIGILRKIARNNLVKQRIFRRYKTHQTTKIQSYLTEDSSEGVLCNLSKGGAYLEGSSYSRFKVGEIVKLHVNLAEVEKSYAVPARVIWTQPLADSSEGMGIEFVKSDEVYKYLLNSM